MKKLALIATIVLGTYCAQSQNYMDAARISERVNMGDARYASMGGAFASLGSNFAAVSDNPAAIGVFENGAMEFSLGNKFSTSKTSFLDQTQRGRNTNLMLNNLGFVGKIELPKNDLKAKYLNLSYTMNRTNDFNANYNMEAYNESSSMTDNFLKNIENSTNDYISQNAFDTYLVDYDSSTSKYFTDFIRWRNGGQERGPYGITQSQNVSTSGRSYENSLSIGTNFNNIVYLGGSFDFGRYTYDETNEYTEADYADNISYFDNFTLTQKLSQYGRGINLKAGVIVKPSEMFRIGLSYHMPRYWHITENYSSYISSNYFANGDSWSYTAPQNGEGDYKYEYNITTPGRFISGASVIFKKSIIVSAGYEYMNYANTLLEADDYSFNDRNKEIEANLRGAGTIKLGTEVRLGPISIRGGAALYQSPYTHFSPAFGKYRNVYTGGLGFRNENFYMDMAFIYTKTPSFRNLYSDYAGNLIATSTNTEDTQVLMTFGFKF